jgi:NAD(P)H-hydrate epimerase
MLPLPEFLYTARAVREMDRIAIESHRVPALELMHRAGAAAWRCLRRRWPGTRRIAVFCGAGNNGGDGYVLAGLARRAGVDVELYGAALPGTDAAREAHKQFLGAGGTVGAIPARLPAAGVVVDALLGTGLDKPVTGAYADAIRVINESGAPVVALDVPSGLNADTGAVMGDAVRATVTISFLGLKAGLLTGRGRVFAGDLDFFDLDLPTDWFRDVAPVATRITPDRVRAFLPERAEDAHKGGAGSVLVVGGNHGMFGAARLAGEAACRTGAGFVRVATRGAYAASLAAVCPELLAAAVEDETALNAHLAPADVVAVGPGLGQDDWSRMLWRTLCDAHVPLVVDADALNLLAQKPERREDWILTPHPGEAARLLDVTAAAVQGDRFDAARALRERYGGVVVLKGSGTIVAGARETYLCDRGNPGMAVAGTGDVLTGTIAALWAQGMMPMDAAVAGVFLHASAGDRSARAGLYGLMASDLLPHLRELRNCVQ